MCDAQHANANAKQPDAEHADAWSDANDALDAEYPDTEHAVYAPAVDDAFVHFMREWPGPRRFSSALGMYEGA